MAIWSIVGPFVILYGHLVFFHVLVFCKKKNLATFDRSCGRMGRRGIENFFPRGGGGVRVRATMLESTRINFCGINTKFYFRKLTFILKALPINGLDIVLFVPTYAHQTYE
jgi:hypothetical protein